MPDKADAALLTELQDATAGEYEIRGVLGRGGMGVVYLAHDITLNRKVAIKVLPPGVLQGAAALERFRREARIAASLRHRHITSVFGLKETTQLVFFVMEYVEGRGLDAILRDQGQLPIDVVEAIIADLASALSYAHRREIVHRDLKPANIIVDVEGMTMVTDFGIAKVSSAPGLTTTGAAVGSPKYMAPEQWSGKTTNRADQYSLGCVAYEMLAGRPPFDGQTIYELMKQQMFDAPEPVGGLRLDCPARLADGVMRMLRKDPDQRWPSLDAALTGMGLHTVPEDAPVRQTLTQLAESGHDAHVFPKTPVSPIPLSGTSRREPPAVGLTRLRWPRHRVFGAILVAAIGLGGFALWRTTTRTEATSNSVVTIDLAPVPEALVAGERVLLLAHPMTAGGAIVNAPVTWSTTDSSIARVSSDGTLAAIAQGTTTITATSEGRTARTLVTVRASVPSVAVLEVTPRAGQLAPGGTLQLAAVAKNAQGTILKGHTVDWSTSDPAVATVSPTGLATGVGPGSAVVTAAADGQQVTVDVVVRGASTVASLELAPLRLHLAVNRSETVRATARDAGGTVLTQRHVDWVSSNVAVATVNPNGVVTALSPGSATIIATSDGITSAPAAVLVVPAGPSLPAILETLIVPAWAYMSIDGVPHGQRTRGTDTLTSGVAHRLRFEHAGFVTVDTTVTLRAGESHLLRIEMVPSH